MNYPKIDLLKQSSHSASHNRKINYMKSVVRSLNKKEKKCSINSSIFEETIFELNFNFGNSKANLKITRDPKSHNHGFSRIRTSSYGRKLKRDDKKITSFSLKKRYKNQNKYTDIIPNSSSLIMSLSKKFKEGKFKNNNFSLKKYKNLKGQIKNSSIHVSTIQNSEKNTISLSKKFDEILNKNRKRIEKCMEKPINNKSFFVSRKKKFQEQRHNFKSFKLKKKNCFHNCNLKNFSSVAE